ncbi:MAG: hypothetical protein KDH15_21685 [Rhodocyclaceae bacterium]|nr:hypothetical protein [Rhodocyclaceae bacterium]
MENPMDLAPAEAAKLVKRQVPEVGKDGKTTGKLVDASVKADEVFASRVRDDKLTVVTTAGEKLTGTLAK